MLDQHIPVPGWNGGDGDASYLDKTLVHHDMELSLDESVSGRTVFHLWLRAFLVAVAWFSFFGVVWVAGGGADSGLLSVASLGSTVIFWLVFLMTRLQEPIGEWKVLLADRAPAKPFVYSQIHGRLRDRQLPISFTARRIRTGLGRDSVGDRVILVDGHYTAYISVFEYGTSLYLGWMMWRTRRGATLAGRFLADVIGGMFGQADPVRLMLRTERPRAMREAVHSVCREGLHVAVEGLAVPETYGFPGGLPPIEDAMPTAAGPVPSAPAAPMPASMTVPAPPAYVSSGHAASEDPSGPAASAPVPVPVPGPAESGAYAYQNPGFDPSAYDPAAYDQAAYDPAAYAAPATHDAPAQAYTQPAFDVAAYDPAYQQQAYAQGQVTGQVHASFQDHPLYSSTPTQYEEFGAADPAGSGFFHRPGRHPEPAPEQYQQYPDQQQWGSQ